MRAVQVAGAGFLELLAVLFPRAEAIAPPDKAARLRSFSLEQISMHKRYSTWTGTPACVLLATVLACCAPAHAQTATWGVNGSGGSGNWDTTTANWLNGSGNVTWPNSGNAIFAGPSGGTVHSFVFGPVVSSMTFNTSGY